MITATAEKLLEAIGNIDSRYIDAAINYQKSAKGKRRVIAVAACIAVCIVGIYIYSITTGIVTQPGLLAITAYALSTDGEIELMEEQTMNEGIQLPIEYAWDLGISIVPGLPLKLSLADTPNATYDVFVDGGQFRDWPIADGLTEEKKYLGDKFSTTNDRTIYWINYMSATGEIEYWTKEIAYADIIIRDGDNIIGYAVVQITANDMDIAAPGRSYRAKLLASVSYPQIDGNYQVITLDYVHQCIRQAKSK